MPYNSSFKQINALKTVKVLGLTFPLLTYEKALSIFQDWIDSKEAHQVCVTNVHTLITTLTDKEFRTINHNALSTIDGVPLVWYANLIHDAGIENTVCGPDLMLNCLEEGQKRGWKHFFLGGKQEVLDTLVNTVKTRFTEVQIVGWYSPPFRPLTPEEDANLVELINTAKPDFLWVALGAPKQEKWIADHLKQINVPVQIGVGAAFDFHSGIIPRAPLWMQRKGLEWIYRISKDKRLIRRYMLTNPIFLALFFRDFLFIKLLKRKT